MSTNVKAVMSSLYLETCKQSFVRGGEDPAFIRPSILEPYSDLVSPDVQRSKSSEEGVS